MNKQSIKLLKEAAYYIKKAEFEKQSAFKGKSMSKAWEAGVKGVETLGKYISKGWNRLLGKTRPKTETTSTGEKIIPTDTGMPYNQPKPRALDPTAYNMPYQDFTPEDKGYADAYLWGVHNKNKARTDRFVTDFPRETIEDSFRRPMQAIDYQWEDMDLPYESVFKSEFAPRWDKKLPSGESYSENYMREALGGARRNIAEQLKDLRENPSVYRGTHISPEENRLLRDGLMKRLFEYYDVPYQDTSKTPPLYDHMYDNILYNQDGTLPPKWY